MSVSVQAIILLMYLKLCYALDLNKLCNATIFYIVVPYSFGSRAQLFGNEIIKIVRTHILLIFQKFVRTTNLISSDPLGIRTQDPILKRDVLYLLS